MKLDHALIVGIDKTDHEHVSSDSVGGVANANCVSQWLGDQFGKLGYEIEITLGLSTFDGEATDKWLTKQIKELCGYDVPPGGWLFFYFSGHGAQFKGRDYLITADGYCVELDSIVYALTRSRFDKVVLVIDACREEFDLDPKLITVKPAERLYQAQHVLVRSTAAKRKAFGDLSKNPPAYFTRGLIEAAKGQGELGTCLPHVTELESRCLRRVDLDGVRFQGTPQVVPMSEPTTGQQYHAPLALAKLPVHDDGGMGASLFANEKRYQRFVYSMLCHLAAGDWADALMRLLGSTGKLGCQAIAIAAQDSNSVSWAVTEILRSYVEVCEPHIVRLTDNPDWDLFLDTLGCELGVDGLPSVQQALLDKSDTMPTALVVVLGEFGAEEIAQQIVDSLWQPVVADYKLKDDRESLSLIFITPSVGGAGDDLEEWTVCTSAAIDAGCVKSWIHRFRHDLPLPLARDADAESKRFVDGGATAADVLVNLCGRLNVEAPGIASGV